MVYVIADDITGAAEMAGVALGKSLSVAFAISPFVPECGADVAVIATDTRSLTAQEAAREAASLAKKIKETEPKARVFKKTDSALRGYIREECLVIMRSLGCDKALIMPQNPSRGRVIVNGRYLINGVPINETAFRDDPEFPAHTSEVEALSRCHCLALGAPLAEDVNIAEGASLGDVALQLQKATDHTLLGGGADAFSQFLDLSKPTSTPGNAHNAVSNEPFNSVKTPFEQPADTKTLVISGSTQSRISLFQGRGDFNIQTLSGDVYHGADPTSWIEQVKSAYLESPKTAVFIGHKSFGGKSYAMRLRHVFSLLAQSLVLAKQPRWLVIEGGATAWSILLRLKITSFEVEKEYSPGVVCLRHGAMRVILKPGSYDFQGLLDSI